MKVRLGLLVGLAMVVSACGGSDGGGTGPSSSTPTRVLALSGDLSFGPVELNTTATGQLRIGNQGNSPLTITGVQGPCGSMFTASFVAGTVQPGATQASEIKFTPTDYVNCSGTVVVNGDQTSGTNTISISASGLFRRNGTGDTVFDMPTHIRRIRIIGTYTGFSTNFVVRVGGSLLVNELLGTGWGTTRYEGTLLTGGGVTQITLSSGVSWDFAQIQ